VRGGVASPAVTVPLRRYGAGTKPGELVGFTVTIRSGTALVASMQPAAPFGIDTTSTFRLTGFSPVKGRTYTVTIEANVFSGGGVVLKRTLTLIAT
jgi:hypothetical protein